MYEERIRARRDEVTSLIGSLERRHADFVESAAWTTNDDEHDPEGATVAFERAQVAALLRQSRDDLDQLARADERLRDGTYGRCQKCGEPIADGRLEALPATTTCIRCA